MQQIYIQFYLDLHYDLYSVYFKLSSDNLQVLIFVCPSFSELSFYICCHPFFSKFRVDGSNSATAGDAAESGESSSEEDSDEDDIVFPDSLPKVN